MSITLQQKDSSDWRSFCLCLDCDEQMWELRGYGDNPESAAANAWERFNDFENWDSFGYFV